MLNLDVKEKQYKYCLSIVEILLAIIKKAGGEGRIVGGIVRDILLNKEQSIDEMDCDIASTLIPEKNLLIFEERKKIIDSLLKPAPNLSNFLDSLNLSHSNLFNLKNQENNSLSSTKALQKQNSFMIEKVLPTGLKHGTITVIANGMSFEITSLRKDVNCDGRHAEVMYTSKWEEDAQRRDFTFNAMFMDIEGKIYDYYNGRQDLRKKIVKFIGNPKERIKEDFLRILRYFRFLSRFGISNIDQNSYLSSIELAAGLKKISGERIKNEMYKIIQYPYGQEVMEIMHKEAVVNYIALEIGPYSKTLYKTLRFLKGEAVVNFVSLIVKASNYSYASAVGIVRRLKESWKLSNKELRKMCGLCQVLVGCDYRHYVRYRNLVIGDEAIRDEAIQNKNDNMIKIHKEFSYLIGFEMYVDFLKSIYVLYGEEKKYNFDYINDIIKHLSEFHKNLPQFPIRGNDLFSIKYIEPIKRKDYLEKLHLQWVTSHFSESKDDLLRSIKRL